MKPKSIDRFLDTPPKELRGVLLYGPDEGQVRERAQELAQKIVPDIHDPFNVSEIACARLTEDPTRLSEEMNAQSLMGGRRLVRIRDGADTLALAVQEWRAQIGGEDSFLIIEAGELGKSAKLRKLFEEDEQNLAAIACYALEGEEFLSFIRRLFQQADVKISSEALALTTHLIDNDRALARNEVEKLILYAGPEQRIEEDDVMAVLMDSASLSLDTPVWAASQGQTVDLDKALERLYADGQSSVAILRATQRHFLRLYEVVSSNAPLDISIKKLQPPVFWKDATRFRQQAQRWRRTEIENVLTQLVTTEAECKKTGAPDTLLCARTMLRIAQIARSQ